MMNPFSWLQMTNMISYQGLVRTFPKTDDQGNQTLGASRTGGAGDGHISGKTAAGTRYISPFLEG
ncbi:hypothetical protein, partial [Aeromonas caviae]